MRRWWQQLCPYDVMMMMMMMMMMMTMMTIMLLTTMMTMTMLVQVMLHWNTNAGKAGTYECLHLDGLQQYTTGTLK